ncbi:MAG: helix-turn-helix domain-containing protein [Acidobacteria bacterium]|nr:helix-turn-helix domain-containing protein [Acidobacteriota bacterium]
MGVRARQRPERLAEKLSQIRTALGLSQTGMLKLLQLEGTISYKKVSDFERGSREPTLLIVLQYARAANVSTDVLIDDGLDLPARLPSAKKHEGVRRRRL